MGFRHQTFRARRLKVLQVLPLLRPCKPVRSECARSSRPTFRCDAMRYDAVRCGASVPVGCLNMGGTTYVAIKFGGSLL